VKLLTRLRLGQFLEGTKFYHGAAIRLCEMTEEEYYVYLHISLANPSGRAV